MHWTLMHDIRLTFDSCSCRANALERSDPSAESVCCTLSISAVVKTQHHATPVLNRAAGAHWGRHGVHQQGHERGREESDRHGSVLWSVYLANEEVGLVSGINWWPKKLPLVPTSIKRTPPSSRCQTSKRTRVEIVQAALTLTKWLCSTNLYLLASLFLCW